MMKKALFAWLMFVAAAFFLGGCDAGFVSSGPATVCVEPGVQCTLDGSGPLGVCERAPCDEEAGQACFRCTPQH